MRLRTLAGASALALLSSLFAVAAGGPAVADTQICDQYGSTTTQDGRYTIQNDRWGTSATQCITATATGFSLTTSNADVPTNGAPASYPSVYWGCHYGACTPGFSPVPVSSPAFAGATTSVGMTYPGSGAWDAAYDIWFDPTARTTGQNTGAEVMVWLDHAGAPQPIGSRVATVGLAGGTWDVWSGNVGWNVISYVRQTPTGSIGFPISTFFDDAVSRGYAQRSWYLTSVQAGFEPWRGGAGLAVTSFSAGTSGSTPAPVPAPAPAPAGATCSIAYHVDSAWQGGLTATATVTNRGPATTSWTAGLTLPAGQSVTSAWNGTATQSGQAVTVRSATSNGSLPTGASTSFGVQVASTAGNGPATAPTLNGRACA